MRNKRAFATLRTAAGIMWEEFGLWAYDTWAAHNAAYFRDELRPAGVIWSLTPHGHALGYCEMRRDGAITLHKSLIESDGNPWHMGAWLGAALAADVLLHEMIHQAIFQRLGHNGEGISSHNNEHWVSEINRIAPLLGLPANAAVIRQKRVDGKVTWYTPDGHMTRAQLATWPHSARPDGYYPDAVAETFGHALDRTRL